MEAEPQPVQPVRSWITERILIALITATAYFWALRYELGWSEHFSIHFQIISLNPISILAFSGLLIYALVALSLVIAL